LPKHNAQQLSEFFDHTGMHAIVNLFYKFLEKAELENKKIAFVEPYADILYDNYPVEDLILVVKQ